MCRYLSRDRAGKTPPRARYASKRVNAREFIRQSQSNARIKQYACDFCASRDRIHTTPVASPPRLASSYASSYASTNAKTKKESPTPPATLRAVVNDDANAHHRPRRPRATRRHHETPPLGASHAPTPRQERVVQHPARLFRRQRVAHLRGRRRHRRRRAAPAARRAPLGRRARVAAMVVTAAALVVVVALAAAHVRLAVPHRRRDVPFDVTRTRPFTRSRRRARTDRAAARARRGRG